MRNLQLGDDIVFHGRTRPSEGRVAFSSLEDHAEPSGYEPSMAEHAATFFCGGSAFDQILCQGEEERSRPSSPYGY